MVGLFLLTWRVSKMRAFQVVGDIVTRVETKEPVVALTFDDGPTPVYTDEVLRILREKGVKATFFLTGSAVMQNPGEAGKIIREGHEIGNHSFSHRRMVLKSWEWIRREIEDTDKAIRGVGFPGTTYFRPPYGKKLLGLPLYLWWTGKQTITWDVEAEHGLGESPSAGQVVNNVLQDVRPGSIVLMHVMYESGAGSRRALPRIIDGIRARGLRLVTVRELMKLRT